MLLQSIIDGVRHAIMLTQADRTRLRWFDLETANAVVYERHGLNIATVSTPSSFEGQSNDAEGWTTVTSRGRSKRRTEAVDDRTTDVFVFVVRVTAIRSLLEINDHSFVNVVPITSKCDETSPTDRTRLLIENLARAKSWLDDAHRPGQIVRFTPRHDLTAFTGYLLGFPFQYSALPGESFKHDVDETITLVSLHYPPHSPHSMTSFSVPSSILAQDSDYFARYCDSLPSSVQVKTRVLTMADAVMSV